jgi:hypothetical protein
MESQWHQQYVAARPSNSLAAPSFTSGAAMTHHRNFYLEKVTTGSASGAQPPIRPHYSADTHADSNVIQLVLPNSRSQEGEPFIFDERELGVKCFLAGLVALVGLIFFAALFVYSSLIA